jgi:predicted RND superfamily exporter protein
MSPQGVEESGMAIGFSTTAYATNHPKTVTGLMFVVTALLVLAAVLPSISRETFPFLNPLRVDTDPENMLPGHEPARIFHNEMKRVFSLHDIVVLGVVNEKDPAGVFRPDSLSRIYELAEYARTLQWDDPAEEGKKVGVIAADVIAPSTVDNIEQGGVGEVRFEWLMPEAPKTQEEAVAIRDKARKIPFLNGTLVSEDGKALCLYLPLTSKDVSYRVYSALQKKIATFRGDEEYFITGLPVANDTFGMEMFRQMAISAPVAMVIIFLFLLFFFRKPLLIVSPMIVALISVCCTMGLLVITGNTVHIMSSMIPIFIMPIAVLDSVHILSEFFDRYQRIRDRRKTIHEVMDGLFMPMLYTSLTSAAGFASLALTPIPPVQIFGMFVALGVLLAWVFTIFFIPAFIMFVPEASLAGFGLVAHAQAPKGALSRVLAWVGRVSYGRAKLVLAVASVIVGIAAYGISRIEINDNPVKWFTMSHQIRIADWVLNEHFGGTYMAYLALTSRDDEEDVAGYLEGFITRLDERGKALETDIPGSLKVFEILGEKAQSFRQSGDIDGVIERMMAAARDETLLAEDDALDAWDEAIAFLEEEKQRGEAFKRPQVLRYLGALQEHMLTTGVVGKSNSVADIVKTVHRELFLGKAEAFRIPDSSAGVAQCLITYQNSHRPQDLWHFVTPDYRQASLWVQLKSGDNKDMVKVVDSVKGWMAENPPPGRLEPGWFGLTYINVVWQAKMVSGMLQAFIGSFLVVFLMMVYLFRSLLWGLLCMIPLTVTIAFIYGAVGIIGKDYDMPIAVLSSLTLGLAVDFAIHFLVRGRATVSITGSWRDAWASMFEEPARAISRNIIVIAVGFMPLLAAPLVPYKTVGIFLSTILVVAGLATLFILPASLGLFERWFFPRVAPSRFICRCVNLVVLTIAAVALVAINLHQYLETGWTALAVFAAVAVLILAIVCAVLSRWNLCKRD